MLVLMLWTGGVAHAAERFDCIPVTEQSAGHFEGDRDQVPESPDRGVAHHHSGCNGHQLAAPTDTSSIALALSEQSKPLPWLEAGVPGHDPESDLRPPIA